MMIGVGRNQTGLRMIRESYLDTEERKMDGTIAVSFHATAEDLDNHRPTIVLWVEPQGVRCAESRTLPPRSWRLHAEAMKRALRFMDSNNLKERTR